jgi:ATP phosphoribosyltransferase
LSKQIRLALPSKGRMEGETLDFLAECGLKVAKTNPRQYSATIPTLPDVLILFQRPRDIPVSVSAGDVDLGITGYDTVVEAVGEAAPPLYTIHEALGYGECRLAFGVPDAWEDVHTVADLARKANQTRLRVATKYLNTVEYFLKQNGIKDVQIIYADGALEAAPSIGYADFIVDITSTGTTFRENHMHTLADGILVESQAVFIANRQALLTRPEVLAVSEQILELMEAHLSAKGKYMIFANMRGATMNAVSDLVRGQSELGGLQFPTIAPLGTGPEDGTWWSVSVVVQHTRLYKAIQQMRAIGGSGVVVTPVTYIFNERPPRVQRLLNVVNGKGELS